MKRLSPQRLVFALALTTGVMSGCDIIEATEESADCVQICAHYQDCIDPDYDVDICADRCRERSNTDDGYEARVDACEDCLDGRSCSETDPCDAACRSITSPAPRNPS